VAADAELRRRHPAEPWPELRSAEPQPEHDNPDIAMPPDTEQTRQRITDLAARHREFSEKLVERQNQMIPAQVPDLEDHIPLPLAWTASARDAILQPPKPQIQPSKQILERIPSRDLSMEAAN
jgi:hypothetical protein